MKRRECTEHLLDILGDLDDNYLKEAEPIYDEKKVKQSAEVQKKREIKWLIPCATVLLYLCLFCGSFWVARAEVDRKNEYDDILKRIEKIEQENMEMVNRTEEKKSFPLSYEEKIYRKYVMNAEHLNGCKAKTIQVKERFEPDNPETSGFYHLYEMTEDGPVYCRVTQTYGLHDIYCAGCKVYICSELRVCAHEHEKCGITEIGFCQR